MTAVSSKLATLGLLCLALIQPLGAQDPAYVVVEDQAKTEILTPSLQQRDTRKLRFANGLEAYLISDPGYTQSAAALAVDVGKWQDPKEHPGMAHFLEHMIFLGTKKYPNESDFGRFIRDNGGLHNAYTAGVLTNYMFSVNHDAFEEALDRFSWFFKEPIFDPSGVDREVNAVDQEFAKNVEDDGRREYAILQEQANPDHPYSRFGAGNLKTLSEISQDELKQWYKDHYSANRMHLVVLSNQPIDRLLDMVTSKFAEVPDYGYEREKVDAPVFSQAARGHKIYIKPLKELRKVSFLWELPAKYAHMMETKPEQLIAFIIGHEGEESLLAQLKREGLADGLSAGGAPVGHDALLFEVEVALTAKGLQEVDTVINRVYQGIARLQQEEIPEYLFREMQQMDRIQYQYQSRHEPFHTVSMHAYRMTREPLETYPERTLIPLRYDAQATKELVTYLTPENCVYTIVGDPQQLGVHPNLNERWLGGEYTVHMVPEKTLQNWASLPVHNAIRLPTQNTLIPESLELVYDGEPDKAFPEPSILVDDNQGRVFYIIDKQYQVPETYWTFDIITPEVDRYHAESLVLADLYVEALSEQLNPFGYDARLAGLKYQITRIDNGIRVAVGGYSQKAYVLFEEIVKNLKKVSPTQEQFGLYRDRLRLRYENFSKETPLRQGGETMRSMLYKEYVTEHQKAVAMRRISYPNFLDFKEKIFHKTYVEGTIHGNLDRRQAVAVWRDLKMALGSLPYPREEHLAVETLVLPERQGPYVVSQKVKQSGHAVLLMLQQGPFTFKRRAAQQILSQAIEEPFYNELRTKQQTGYLVYSWDSMVEKQLFSYLAVQSNSHDPRDLLARFELFLETFQRELAHKTFTEERFQTIKQSLITLLKQAPDNMRDMSQLLHKVGFEYDGDFKWIDKRVAAVEALTYEEFIDFAKEWQSKQNRQRLAVVVHGIVVNPDLLTYTKIQRPSQLKKICDYITRDDIKDRWGAKAVETGVDAGGNHLDSRLGPGL